MTLKKAYYGGYEEKLRKRKAVIAVVCVALAVIIIAIAALSIKASRNTSNKNENHDSSVEYSNQLPEVVDDKPSTEVLSIPKYSGTFCVEINDNIPFFAVSDLKAEAFEYYSPLDDLGRCGSAIACVGKETMPTEERGSIGMIKPTGWHTVRYDDLIDDKYLYNRCHLIAFALSGENANELNLITGTRYLNVSGMLPYENKTADYIDRTGNHVLYRVTPIFEGENLVATGVLMEAQSVEDNGAGLMFNVFIYNVQPGITIDYLTGDSYAG